MAHSPAYSKTPKPTLAQIEAAKKAEAEKKKIADAAAAKLSKANLTLKQLTAVANAARAKYEAAKRELAIATEGQPPLRARVLDHRGRHAPRAQRLRAERGGGDHGASGGAALGCLA